MVYQFLERTQTPAYILILVVMSHGLMELHGLRVWLHMDHICSPNKLSSEINFIKKLASWNSFPIFAAKKIIHQVLNTTYKSSNNTESPGVLTILRLYYSDKGLSLLKSCLCKIWSNCVKTHSIRLKTQYDVNKIEFYSNNEDKTVFWVIHL